MLLYWYVNVAPLDPPTHPLHSSLHFAEFFLWGLFCFQKDSQSKDPSSLPSFSSFSFNSVMVREIGLRFFLRFAIFSRLFWTQDWTQINVEKTHSTSCKWKRNYLIFFFCLLISFITDPISISGYDGHDVWKKNWYQIVMYCEMCRTWQQHMTGIQFC
jgi:hypothetical protein